MRSSRHPIHRNGPLSSVLSNHTLVMQYLNNYLDFCLNAPASLFYVIRYMTCVGREHYHYRFTCVVHNTPDLIMHIEGRFQNISMDAAAENARRILLAFPGQRSQYQGMGRYLAAQCSGFQQIITDAANKAAALTSYSILPFLVEESTPRDLTINNSEVALVCIFVFQYAVATWLA